MTTRLQRHPWLSVVVLCLGGLAAAMTQTVVIPIQGALPTLLHTSPSNAGWVVTATLLTSAVSMPVSGRLGNVIGKRRVVVVGAVALTIGSLTCALSDTVGWMVAGRGLQGLSLGIVPVGIAMMREVTPPEITNTAVAAMGATLAVGGAFGLPLSAWLAQTFDWHSLFWMSAALGVVVIVSVLGCVPRLPDREGGRLDLVGTAGLVIVLFAVLIAVSKGHEWGWSHPRTWGLLLAGAVVLVAWCRVELRTTDSLVDLRVTARRPVLLTNLGAGGIGFSMMVLGIVMPQLLQQPVERGGLGQTVLATGMWMAPGGVVLLVTAPFAARLLTLVGARWTLITGAAAVGGSYAVAYALMHEPWQLTLVMCIGSAGVGIAHAGLPTLIMAFVPTSEAGAAVGLSMLMRAVGMAGAAAAMATVLSSHIGPLGGPTPEGYRLCFALGGLAALVGVVLTWCVPQPHARAAHAGDRR